MAAATNIVINDGAATPVAHTFVPSNRDANGVMVFVDQSPDIPAGYHRITANLREPQGNSADFRVDLRLWFKTLEVTSPSTSTGIQPAPMLAYQQVGGIELRLPKRGSKQERKNTRVLLKNLLENAQIAAMIDDLINVY